ncbi:carbohydrate kinase family protein [Dactylosporangium matsuzakiense]|uniref:Ribokinase n=1 Tax=Dactylosporangium matsuzakiense TaxID=53360 RepID=A0A9W6NQW0_9ACTN|nr:sugar kinase [Dactylosporangium matsuzakiense]UWZ46480.1 sugar kinase [Dactylosporangium matsuzakiense]GLL06610.1 ribokinase [Dactylosporangium matsuzakiense]
MTALVIGDVVTDILTVHEGPLAIGSDTIARVRTAGGGSAANTAVWLAAAGSPVAFAGVAGADEPGDARIAELQAAGVITSIRRVPGVATGSVVVLTSDAERTMFTDRGANRLLSREDVERALALPSLRHLHLSAYVLFDEDCAPAGRYALEEAHRRGLTTSLDAASAAPLQSRGGPKFLASVPPVDLLFANLDEAQVLGSTNPADLRQHAKAAVVKAGPAGATYADAAQTAAAPATPVAKIVDPTGAGDAFAAGFLTAWLTGRPPAEALAAGNTLGARAVQNLGARP